MQTLGFLKQSRGIWEQAELGTLPAGDATRDGPPPQTRTPRGGVALTLYLLGTSILLRRNLARCMTVIAAGQRRNRTPFFWGTQQGGDRGERCR